MVDDLKQYLVKEFGSSGVSLDMMDVVIQEKKKKGAAAAAAAAEDEDE